MILKKKIISIIPARKNSKRIKNKNLQKIGLESLAERAIKFSLSSKLIHKTIVSTDDKKIFKIAKKYNCNELNLRNKKLSTSKTRTVELLFDMIKKHKLENCYILILQCTSPFRKKSDLKKILSIFQKDKANAVISVEKNTFPHPLKVLKKKDKYLYPYLNNETNVPRQELSDVYVSNGAYYLICCKKLLKYKTLIPPKTSYFVMSKIRSINIDYPDDLKLSKIVYEKMKL
tara:strand:+ start:61 stop:753 length:693 start_codon:yes stop_codon:yes gene_type:complete